MNFLAHCLIPELAAEPVHPDLLAGGFAGDFLKGPVPEDLPPVLALGVRLHRRIDAYSNQHPGIRQSCGRFPPELRRIAPVVVDVVADHLLARNFQRYTAEPLPGFTERAYAAIGARLELLPEHARRFYYHMRELDLLARYREPEAMQQALASVTRRLGLEAVNPDLEHAVEAALPGLQADFLGYFPELVAHAERWLAEAPPGARERSI